MPVFKPTIKKLEKSGDIEGLKSALKDDNHSRREKAAQVLDRMGWVPETDEGKAYSFAAKWAWDELAALGEAALEPLKMTLTHPNSTNEQHARQILENMAGDYQPAVQKILIDMLKNSGSLYIPGRKTKRLKWAVELLGKIGDREAVVPLVISLQSQQPHVMEAPKEAKKELEAKYERYKGVIAEAIRSIGASAIPSLIEAIIEDGPFGYSYFAEALGFFDESAVDILMTYLEDDNPLIREKIAAALGVIGSKEALELLVNHALNDGSKEVRASAHNALGQIGGAEALRTLAIGLKDDDYYVRRISAKALRGMGARTPNKTDWAYFLFALATSPEPGDHVQQNELDAVARLGEAAVAPLIDSLQFVDDIAFMGIQYKLKNKVLTKIPVYNSVSDIAFMLLEKIGRPAYQQLIQASSHENPDVRSRAIKLLERMRK